MQNEIIISGFGGQGVLFTGKVLAYAAMESGKHITCFPSYGPEMRGGTANCTIIIADEEIGSPNVRNPQAVIALNLPSMDKYEHLIKTGGLLLINSSLVNRKATRDDINVIEIPANQIADEAGDQQLINMLMLGTLIEASQVLTMASIKMALEEHLPKHHRDLLSANFELLDKGAKIAQSNLAIV